MIPSYVKLSPQCGTQGIPLFISIAESVQLCYTKRNIVCIRVVHIHVVHVVLVVVNNLIRGHNIIMKTTVASGCKLPVPELVTRCPLDVTVCCGHHDELTPLVQWFGWSS